MISNLIELEGEEKYCLCPNLYQMDVMKGNAMLVKVD